MSGFSLNLDDKQIAGLITAGTQAATSVATADDPAAAAAGLGVSAAGGVAASLAPEHAGAIQAGTQLAQAAIQAATTPQQTVATIQQTAKEDDAAGLVNTPAQVGESVLARIAYLEDLYAREKAKADVAEGHAKKARDLLAQAQQTLAACDLRRKQIANQTAQARAIAAGRAKNLRKLRAQHTAIDKQMAALQKRSIGDRMLGYLVDNNGRIKIGRFHRMV